MKVIFIKDLKGQGKIGDIKEVKDGYGMNFLVKNGYAVVANSGSIKHLETEKVKKDLALKDKITECEKMKKEIEKLKLSFKVKTGEMDRVFGSVSVKQIVSELKKFNFDVDKKQVLLDSPLVVLGFHKIKIELHKQVIADLDIQLVKE